MTVGEFPNRYLSRLSHIFTYERKTGNDYVMWNQRFLLSETGDFSGKWWRSRVYFSKNFEGEHTVTAIAPLTFMKDKYCINLMWVKQHLFRSHDTWVRVSTLGFKSLISCATVASHLFQFRELLLCVSHGLSMFKTLREIQSLVTSLGFSFLIGNIKVSVQMIFNVLFNSVE